jgi:hypothetical protein
MVSTSSPVFNACNTWDRSPVEHALPPETEMPFTSSMINRSAAQAGSLTLNTVYRLLFSLI